MKKIVCLLFFLSIFLFILPQSIYANHIPECGSACGGTCKPNEESCAFPEGFTFCMSNPKNPNCVAAAPTPIPCKDTDPKNDILNSGTCAGLNGTWDDFCSGPASVSQFKCDSSTHRCVVDTFNTACASGSTCVNGACASASVPLPQPPTACSGNNKSLILKPNTGPANKSIDATVDGLINCNNKLIMFRPDSCSAINNLGAGCFYQVSGCTGKFAPQSTMVVRACVDLNGTSILTDDVELASAPFTIGSGPGPQPPGTQPPGTQPPGTVPPGTQPPGTQQPAAQPPKCSDPGKSCSGATCCSPSTCVGFYCTGPTPTPNPLCLATTCDKNGATCGTSCEDYVCDKRLFGAGKCVPKATFCPRLIAKPNCSLVNGDGDCRDGSAGCDKYFCHPDAHSKVILSGKCKLDPPPSTSATPTPTKEPPFSPCAKWEYNYPDPKGRCINNPDVSKLDPNDFDNNCRLNGQTISPNDLENADSRNIKCVALNTAAGKIDIDPKLFVGSIFSRVLGLAGGIALILIMISGYKFMTSGGNPESFQAAKEMLVSAILGLLFIIFSFVILQIIGVDILHIPGFG